VKSSKKSVQLDDRHIFATVSAGGMTVTFDKNSGYIAYIDVAGKQITQDDSQLVPDFWRAPTDNDYGAGMQNKLAAWQHPRLEKKSFDIKQDGSNVVATASYDIKNLDAQLQLTYTMMPCGKLIVTQAMTVSKDTKDKPQPLRFGMNLQLKKQFDQIEYYGKGPRENYIDRQNSESLAVWKQTVAEQYYPYIRPQESGTKCQVRYWQMTDKHGLGLRFEGTEALECQALEYTEKDLQPTREKRQFHSGDLIAQPFNDVHISARSMGIGCVNSWGAWPRKEYSMEYKDYTYTYIISPVK
jgi:beta-galactosidase